MTLKTVPLSTLVKNDGFIASGAIYVKVAVPSSTVQQGMLVGTGDIIELPGTLQVVPVTFKPVEIAGT